AVMTHIQLKVDNGPQSSGGAHPVPQAHGGVRWCDRQNYPTAVLSAIPQQVQSHRTRLGNLGTALGWSPTGGYRNHAGMGEKHDLER
ncbi:hypothetical protein SAMN05428978_10211, partial [Nitrosomonas sp. Nm34]